MNTVFMFPGQGAQQVGMGKDLYDNVPEIAQLYQEANEIVGYDLASVCFSGPLEQLSRTDIAQPAIFLTSAACLAALRMGLVEKELSRVEPDACAGLSLGEYTALYAAGAMSFEQALELVQLRGQSMQRAAQERTGSMVSILGLNEADVERLCRAVLQENISEADGMPVILEAVNFNCPGQIVLSGSIKACQRAEELAGQFGASRAVPLQVAGAFHTGMMESAARKLQAALQKINFSEFDSKVIANVDAQFYDRPADIPDKLIRQLTGSVRWQHSMEQLLDMGAERFVEIGPGRTLIGLLKKIARARKQKVTTLSIKGLD